MNWPNNPFRFGIPVDEDDTFQHRAGELEDLRREARDPSRTLIRITGPRRIGKTSLLRRFIQVNKNELTSTFLDLREVTIAYGKLLTIDAAITEVLSKLSGRILGKETIIQDVREFRSAVLVPHLNAHPTQRCAILLDEMDVLEERYAAAIEQILSAFLVNSNPAPIIVYCSGRPIGAPRTEGIGYLFKGAYPIDLSLFSESETMATPDKATIYSFTPEARTRLYEMTKGHPFWVSAVNHFLYRERSQRDDTANVSASELEDSVESISKKASLGIWQTWEKVPALQSAVCRAVADLTWDESAKRFSGDATSAEIENEARRGFSGIRTNLVPKVLPDLERDFILESANKMEGEKEQQRWRLHAPFLGYWLRAQEIDDFKRVGNREARELYERACAAFAAKDISSAKELSVKATELDPEFTDALIFVGRLEMQDPGTIERAILRFESARKTDSEAARIPLRDSLSQRILMSRGKDENPDVWFYKLRDIDPECANKAEIVSAVCDFYLDKWEAAIWEQRFGAAQAFLESLVGHPIKTWRQEVASRYAAAMNKAIALESPVPCCSALVSGAFLLLTAEPLAPIGEVLSHEVEQMLQRMPDERSQRIAREYFIGNLDQFPWWTSTIKALRKILLPARLERLQGLSFDIVSRLLHICPETHLAELKESVINAIETHLSNVFLADPDDSASAIRLLCEQSAPHRKIAQAFEDAIVRTVDRPDDEVVRVFSGCITALLQWCEFLPVPNDSSERLLDAVELLFDRLRHPRGDVPADHPEWELFVRGAEALEKWRDMLRHRVVRSERAKAIAQSLVPTDGLIQRAIQLSAYGPNQVSDNIVLAYLNRTFGNVRPLSVTIPGIPAGVLKFFRAIWNGEEVTLKVYHLAPDGRSTEFFTYLWENERRALLTLSSRVTGRALTRFRFADRVKDSASGGFLVIATEPSGTRTLRDYLRLEGRSGFLGPDRRQELWRAIHALMESVHALHRAHYLHRSIRPENIFVHGPQDSVRLKLANFEWSVYLHSLADGLKFDDRWLDRYTAPEALARRFSKHVKDGGEGFSSDVYSLGLVLFELLVRQLSPEELEKYYRPEDYDEIQHRQWLLGLRKEVQTSLSSEDDIDARLLILEMLEPAASLRRADMDDLVQLTSWIAWAPREIERAISRLNPFITAVTDPKNDTCISKFLDRRDALDFGDGTEKEIIAALERELSGARVYRNINKDRPLIIDGRRVQFTAAPFEQGEGSTIKVVPEIPYLTVGTTIDRKDGIALGKLPEQVRILPVGLAHRELQRHLGDVVRRGAPWRKMFDISASDDSGLTREMREFYTILQATVEVEEEIWKKDIGEYEVKRRFTNNGRCTVVISDLGGSTRERHRLSVSSLVAGHADRGERMFELCQNDNPTAPILTERIWKLEKVERGEVTLSKEGIDSARDAGFIRPESMKGYRAVKARRLAVLQRLRDDAYLLKTVVSPSTVLERRPVSEISYCGNIDDDKKRIVRTVLETRPLCLVQGPPGTGKTTLAAEIIRQTLNENPSARILITAQAHEPLNNLLARVESAFESTDQNQRPSSVRIMPTERLRSHHWPSQAEEIVRRSHPAEVARRHMELAKKWRPGSDSQIAAELVSEWRSWLNRRAKDLPAELARRITHSANLVYATANDRSLADLPEDRDFDLLIFEEAAKAYPLEVLGPMVLSRRWMLIGDHEQLPAFNIEDFRNMAALSVGNLYERGRRVFGLRPESASLAIEIADFFEYLFTKGTQSSDRSFVERLSLQWRMHPAISAMLRDIYYDFLRDGDGSELAKLKRHRISFPEVIRKNSVIWIDVPIAASNENRLSGLRDEGLAGDEPASGGGFINPYEARVLHNLMGKVQVSGHGGLRGDIAFLSPYKAQVALINKFLRSWDGKRNPNTGDLRDRAYTVDSFQGRQAKVVVVSLVRNNSYRGEFEAFGFLYGDEGRSRSAVMFSRAEELLVVIGSSEHFKKGTNFHIKRVFEYIQEHGAVVDAREFLDRRDYEELRKHVDGRRERNSREE